MILLNPGPANTTQTVKQALLCADICPRERVFGDLCQRVSRQLVRVVDDKTEQGGTGEWVAVLFGGSGTAAVEAAIASAVPPSGRLLVLDNGAYGARMADIAAAYGIPHRVSCTAWGEPLDTEQVRRTLASDSYTHVAVVHHETTTGMLNPVQAIGEVCHSMGVEVIVDAMSSYAGIPIDIRRLSADYLVSSANKCLQGMAGLSFVIGRRERIAGLRRHPGRSLYLDLGEQYRFFCESHQMRFTPPVPVVYALAQALDEFFAEGQAARHRRYLGCWAALDQGMRELGFRRLLPEPWLSKILTAYLEPDHPRYCYDQLHDQLHRRGYTIYPGKGAKQATFRLANMGAIEPSQMVDFVSALADTIDQLGLRPLYRDQRSAA